MGFNSGFKGLNNRDGVCKGDTDFFCHLQHKRVTIVMPGCGYIE